jgi:plastocyanin
MREVSMKHRLSKEHLFVGVAVASLTLAACGGDDEPTGSPGGGTAASIAVISGDDQRVAVGRSVLEELVVKVTNAQGGGVSSQTVTWEVTAGGGTVSQSISTTNVNGEASISFTAAASEEDNTVSATVGGLTPVDFTIKAVVAASIVVTAGDAQSARTSQPLAEDLEVRVTASDNGPVPNLPVAWAVTLGGGSLAGASTNTNADGRATNGFTLGSGAGANASTASAAALGAVTFNATGTTPVTVTVDMQNIAFSAPGGGDDVTIMLGDTVRWVNQDAVQHTATSTSMPAGGASFDSGFLSQSEAFTYVPNSRGTWVYFCEVHPVQMRDATITVQ